MHCTLRGQLRVVRLTLVPKTLDDKESEACTAIVKLWPRLREVARPSYPFVYLYTYIDGMAGLRMVDFWIREVSNDANFHFLLPCIRDIDCFKTTTGHGISVPIIIPVYLYLRNRGTSQPEDKAQGLLLHSRFLCWLPVKWFELRMKSQSYLGNRSFFL